MSRAFMSGQEGGGPFKIYEIAPPMNNTQFRLELQTVLDAGIPDGDYLFRFVYWVSGVISVDIMFYVKWEQSIFSLVLGGPCKTNGINYSKPSVYTGGNTAIWINGVDIFADSAEGYAIAL